MPSARLDSSRPAIAFALALGILVLGATGCGGSDEQAADSTAPTASAPVATAPQPKQQEPTGGGGSKDGGAPVGGSQGPTLLGDREQARVGAAVVGDVYGGLDEAVKTGVASDDVGVSDTLKAADGASSLTSVCDLMSEAAKRQAIVYAERSSGLGGVDWTCEKATGLLLRRGASDGGPGEPRRATVVGVNVEGDRATATVRFGGKKGLSTIPLVKEDGKWKLGASPGGGS